MAKKKRTAAKKVKKDSKQYTKTHKVEKALKGHLKNIKKRGGIIDEKKGLTIKYHFPA